MFADLINHEQTEQLKTKICLKTSQNLYQVIIGEKIYEGLFQGIICEDFPILTQKTSATLFTVLEAIYIKHEIM